MTDGEEMSRRRYISTDISLDEAVNDLASNCGDFAALLYTWLIVHAEDNAIVEGSLQKLKMRMLPGRDEVTTQDIRTALAGIEEHQLITFFDEDAGRVYLPIESFYKYQTYIKEERRRKEDVFPPTPQTPTNSAKRRRTAQNVASHSLSLSHPIKEESSSKIFDETTDAYRLSLLLRELVLRNNPKAKVPGDSPKGLAKWAAEIDRAIRIDNRAPADLERVVRWSQDDEFWMTNILSTKKLREQFDKLWMRMNRVPKWQPPSPRIVNEL